jgi:menaquinone-dependent protoporphyrinogen oxidase
MRWKEKAMNKKLLLYETKKGMTQKLAQLLKESVSDMDVFEAKKFNGRMNQYDSIILGTPIYMGKINKHIKKVMNEKANILSDKKTAIYLCGMGMEDEPQVIMNNFTKKEIDHYFIHYLGGAYNFERMNFLQKFIIKKLTGESQSKEIVLEKKMKELINYISN